MRYSPLTQRLQGLGGDKWQVHNLAWQMQAEGRDVIDMTIGEPDVPCPPALIETAYAAMRALCCPIQPAWSRRRGDRLRSHVFGL